MNATRTRESMIGVFVVLTSAWSFLILGCQGDGWHRRVSAGNSRGERKLDESNREGRGVAFVHPDVHSELANGANAKVSVLITMDPVAAEATGVVSRESTIKAIQEKVLSTLSPQQFDLSYRFTRDCIIVGNVSMEGLLELLSNTEVVAIGFSKVEPGVYTTVQYSRDGKAPIFISVRPVTAAHQSREHHLAEMKGHILGKIKSEDFEVLDRHEGHGFISGRASARALETLELDPHVMHVSGTLKVGTTD